MNYRRAFTGKQTVANRRVIKSVLPGFLGTYTSRYSDYGGYWLFGFLVRDLTELEINLVTPLAHGGAPFGSAIQLAVTKFGDQVRKAGLNPWQVREARLIIKKCPNATTGSINGHACVGHILAFRAMAIMDDGRSYASECETFVSPHDPEVERQRRREDWLIVPQTPERATFEV